MVTKFQRNLRRHKTSALVRQLITDDSGSPIIEFAFVVLPTLALIIGTIQMGWVFFASQTLQTINAAAARTLMIGTMQNLNSTQIPAVGSTPARDKTAAEKMAEFKNQICNGSATSPSSLPSFMSCNNIFFIVDSPTTLSPLSSPLTSVPALTIDANGNLTNSSALSTYTTGGAGSYMVVRVFSVINVLPGLQGEGLSNIAGHPNQRLMSSVSVIKAEPY